MMQVLNSFNFRQFVHLINFILSGAESTVIQKWQNTVKLEYSIIFVLLDWLSNPQVLMYLNMYIYICISKLQIFLYYIGIYVTIRMLYSI